MRRRERRRGSCTPPVAANFASLLPGWKPCPPTKQEKTWPPLGPLKHALRALLKKEKVKLSVVAGELPEAPLERGPYCS